jgi:GxxExxY protein
MEVHRQLGCGSLEPVYQEALAIEFTNQDIPFSKEAKWPLTYKGQPLDTSYRADCDFSHSLITGRLIGFAFELDYSHYSPF